ncbi:MAG: flagellin [Fibromonadaceae bacterium]|jgi:flagellin-like hook-associated protein FlgL|nr:flagellin [Fibromonadaceae bacterium]
MQINHNIGAMVTQHALYQNNTSMGKSLEKLSTGLRINRAQDDAAGLAMSEQMRTQIRGLGKAKRNAQDGIAALQIAEGGLAEITNMMQRQKELAVQAANDTLTSTERKYLDMEFQELTKEIARISKTTDYNGKNMLNWSEDPNLSFGAIGDKNLLKDQMEVEHAKMMSYINQLTDITRGYVTTGMITFGASFLNTTAVPPDGRLYIDIGNLTPPDYPTSPLPAPPPFYLDMHAVGPDGEYLMTNDIPPIPITIDSTNGFYLFLDKNYDPKMFLALDDTGNPIPVYDNMGQPVLDPVNSNPIYVLADPSGIGAAMDVLKHLSNLPNDTAFYIGDPFYKPIENTLPLPAGTSYADDYQTFIDNVRGAYDPLTTGTADPFHDANSWQAANGETYYYNPETGFPMDKYGNHIPPPVQNPPNPNWTVLGAFNAFERAVAAIDIDAMDPRPTAMKDLNFLEAIKERLDIIVNSISQPSSDSLSRLYLSMVKNDMTNAASYTLHIGPNYSTGMGTKWANEMTVTYISFNPGSLGLSTKNLKMQHHATEAIDHLNDIIKDVAGVRAKIGTYINRLEYTISNCANLEYNTQDAESRIRDTDFAEATTEFTKNQILVQSATSMLAQANTLPQTALQLIQG